jgi:hypothetical protein
MKHESRMYMKEKISMGEGLLYDTGRSSELQNGDWIGQQPPFTNK